MTADEVAPQRVYPWVDPPARNGLAVAGFVCGVVGGAFFGVVLGPLGDRLSAGIGWARAARGEPHPGHGIAAVVFGVVDVVVSVALFSPPRAPRRLRLRAALMTTTQQRNLVERTLLDEQMRELRRDDRRSWGLAGWLGPIVALAVIIAAGNVLADTVVPHHGTGRTAVGIVLSIGAELLLLAVLLAFGRAIAARDGGWRAAFGLDRIRSRDWLPWLGGWR